MTTLLHTQKVKVALISYFATKTQRLRILFGVVSPPIIHKDRPHDATLLHETRDSVPMDH